MSYLSIPYPPKVFSDDDLQNEIPAIRIGETCYFLPIIYPHGTNDPSNMTVTIYIVETDSFSFLTENGRYVDALVFENIDNFRDVGLEFILIEDGDLPGPLGEVSLEFVVTAPHVSGPEPRTHRFAYV
ncbi:hypothetical protein [Chitinophaga sp. YIM B06452]|uniref:hypothetical protein n=1 Tax=Chitinophaga sp. YIM B06452 TaxID=3082158 RepID=UPI0031FF31D6